MRAGDGESRRMAIADVGTCQKPDDRHPGCNASLDTANAILDDETGGRISPHAFCRVQEDIRVRFATRDLGRAVDVRAEKCCQIQNIETESKPIGR